MSNDMLRLILAARLALGIDRLEAPGVQLVLRGRLGDLSPRLTGEDDHGC